MRRFFCTLLAGFVIALAASAQDTSQADKAFNAGKYDDAKNMYEMAASLIKDKAVRDEVYNKAKKCTSCKNKLAEANGYFRNHDYNAANKAYKELRTLNPKDPTANSRIAEIPRLIERAKADDAKWAEVQYSGSYERYKEYASAYPSGKHISEARERMRAFEAEEKERQQAAAREEALREQARQQEENAYRSFANNRQLQSGLAYLSNYGGDGTYSKEVKDILVELYCDKHEYSNARKYITGDEKRLYVQTHERNYERQRTAKAEAAAFMQFDKNRTEAGARSFMNNYPYGNHAEEVSRWLANELCAKYNFADARKYAVGNDMLLDIDSKEEDYRFEQVRRSRDLDQEKEYIDKYPSGKNTKQVREWYVKSLIQQSEFDKARKYADGTAHLAAINQAEENLLYDQFVDLPSSIRADAYLKHYPNGSHSKDVRERMVKSLCQAGDFVAADKYAGMDADLTNYIQSARKTKQKTMASQQKKAERVGAYDDFASHFLDFTVGAGDDLYSFGAMYSCVPRGVGFYLGGEYVDESFSAFVGPVFRLTKDSSAIDLQLYGGVGINFYDFEFIRNRQFSNVPLVYDLGIRLGTQQTKFSVIDFCAGVRYCEDYGRIFYGGVSIVLPFALMLL